YYSKGCCPTIHHRGAIFSVLLNWTVIIAFGTLPYLLIERSSSVCNSFFESVIGYTSTGLSVFQNVEKLSKSILFYRSLTQWVGGLGIIVLLTFLLPSGVCTKKLYDNETSVLDGELTAYSVKRISYGISMIYAALTLCCTLLFYKFGMSLFDAICHAFTTVSTGGLSTYNDGFMHFQSTGIKCTAIIFMLIGGTNFQVISSIFLFRRLVLKKNDEFKAYFIILGIMCGLILILNRHILHPIDGIFQVVSAVTTTGFSATNITMIPISYVLLLTMMLIGGCTGSTAGGVKIARLLVIFKSIRQQIELVFRPRLVRALRINNNVIDQDVVLNHTSIFCLHIILIATTVFIIGIIQPLLNTSSILAIVTASISNAGIIFEPSSLNDIASLHTSTKIILSLIMLLGRLEIYPILCIFLRSFWGKRKN
ncbi:MAG: TrkH family potassium uptake protein, partial [Opitutales bacterium]|nr:TrkH family potassium uptake protein [Opitutales bacterium]